MKKSLEAVILMAASSVLSLGLGAVRMKLVALELGSTGVGSLGVLMAAAATLATFFGFGLGVSGVGAVAASLETDGARLARDALRRGTWALAPAAGLISTGLWFWWGDTLTGTSHRQLSPWVGLAVAATILAARPTAVLSGLGKVRHVAVVNVVAAALATVALPAAMLSSRTTVLAVALAAPPIALFLSGSMAVRLFAPPVGHSDGPWRSELRSMARLGLAVSSAVIMVSASQLFAASWVTRNLGLDQTGLFQASWSIASLYLTFLLSALTVEYLPRLSKLRHDRSAMVESTDHQVRLLVVIAGPVIAWLMILAPYLLELLYAPEFAGATNLLRLQLLGDVFKVLGWTVAFLLLAQHARTRYFLGELSWNASFTGLVALLAAHGLEYVGFAYAAAYVVYLFVTLLQTGFRPSLGTLGLVGAALAGVGAVYVMLAADIAAQWRIPEVLAGALSIWALWQLYRLYRSPTRYPPHIRSVDAG